VFEYGRTKFPEDVSTPGSNTHTHTRDSQYWQVSVVIPFAKHFPETTKQVEKAEESFM